LIFPPRRRIFNGSNETPDIREEKVQELKRQIDTGKYSVNADKLAEKIVGESLIDILA
jgi:flagellar biosynthesis anti-sigma factor FlgM